MEMIEGLLVGGVGLVGISCMSFMFPTATALYTKLIRKESLLDRRGVALESLTQREDEVHEAGDLSVQGPVQDSPCPSIRIVVPVFNDHEKLEQTLSSISAATKKTEHVLSVAITVVDDGSDDGSTALLSAVASHYGADFVRHEQNQGKWKVLARAVSDVEKSDWVGFVDAGTVWPFRMLEQIRPYFSARHLAGIAPGYRSPHKGWLQSLHWNFESALKSLENISGGPISVHGATVFYRQPLLKRALRKLRGYNWRNDDVVIPLMIRMNRFVNVICYLSDIAVYDYEVVLCEQRTRSRMAQGNIEWIRVLLGEVFRRSPLVGVIALRRVFRTFWVYWIAFLILGGALLSFGSSAFLALLAAMSLLYVVQLKDLGGRALQALTAAAAASFMTPFQLIGASDGGSEWR